MREAKNTISLPQKLKVLLVITFLNGYPIRTQTTYQGVKVEMCKDRETPQSELVSKY